MLCSWCDRENADALPLFLTPQAEDFGRFLPEVSQQEPWCPVCRSKVAVLIERVKQTVRAEIRMPRVCCVCAKVLSGAVSHGYCQACAKSESRGFSARTSPDMKETP